MAFPTSPTDGQVYTTGGVTYVFNSTKGVWQIQTYDTVDAAGALTALQTVDGSGSALDADLLDGLTSSQFLRSDANDITTAQIMITRSNGTATGDGQLYINGSGGNRIDFNNQGVAAPSYSTRSSGTKLVLYPELSSASVDYALGIESNTMWFSVPSATSARYWKWYAGTNNVMTVDYQGKLSCGNIRVGADTVDPDTYTNSVIMGAISDTSWSVSSAVGGKASGAGDTWAIGHNASALYFGIGDGATDSSLSSFMRADPNKLVHFYGVADFGGPYIKLPIASSDPASPTTGAVYFNTASNTIKQYDGSAWAAVYEPPLGTVSNPATSALAILNAGDSEGDGYYYILLNGVATEVYCDMTTDGGGWMLLWSTPAGATSSTYRLATDRTSGNVGSEFANNSLSYAQRSGVRAVCSQTQSLVKNTNGGWMRFNVYIWNSTTHTSGNYHFHQNCDIVTSNGTTDTTATVGIVNYNNSSGGDFGVAAADNGIDHHSTNYYELNSGCSNDYLYQYGMGYKVNTSLSGWNNATSTCTNNNTNDIGLALYMR